MAKRVEYAAKTEILNSVLRCYALFCNLALFAKVIEVGKEKKQNKIRQKTRGTLSIYAL